MTALYHLNENIAHLLEGFLESAVPLIAGLAEVIGLFIIVTSLVKATYHYVRTTFFRDRYDFHHEMSTGLTTALEFLMSAEIAKTFLLQNLEEGVEQPKPLVPVCGEPMIERLLRIFVDCGATEIVVIVNEWSTAVREHIESLALPVPLRLVVKTTPSSMHSLHALSPYLRGERFCLTTVDTIFREAEFKKYIRQP